MSIWKSIVNAVGDINNSVGSSLGKHKKFVQWADENNYKIEKLEFSSYLEAKFSYWQVPRSHTCIKAILVDKENNRRGAYLMTGLGQPVWNIQTKFVQPDEIIFKNFFTLNDKSELVAAKEEDFGE
ncbi:MAG: hypothetical protein H7Z37_11770 [Pyrinomonadaceae bacterium]|nr:hypothetical protein [Pyrinomonadaceae bacterium]